MDLPDKRGGIDSLIEHNVYEDEQDAGCITALIVRP